MKNTFNKADSIIFIANEEIIINEDDDKELNPIIEPWLSAIFQSEHFSLLLGSGFTTAACVLGEVTAQAMQRIEFTDFQEQIKNYADSESEKMFRGSANFEDDIRTAIELLKGLKIQGSPQANALEQEINNKLNSLITNLIQNENALLASENHESILMILKRFLISFASRTASRDRLHIFTTNYDRLIEYVLDSAGIYTLDRFVGKLNPIMQMHKMEMDYHYNPPGIRGEPRYVEGVVRLTKLHGSLDWRYHNNFVRKVPIPFGDDKSITKIDSAIDTCIVYPNSSKGIDTAYFPYSELFRDFSTAICRPNSVLITFGYGFGDSHINSIIMDMMSILSTHLVIISYDNASDRIQKFFEKCNPSQITLLIGKQFGDLGFLTNNCLPKSALDKISIKKQELQEKRGDQPQKKSADVLLDGALTTQGEK